ncbi:MAG: ABC transporter ATPase [Mucilaginibacter polytrichastri]|nr:ABC transporter ATPase [Mucilaginibacter polytrichastri]
MKNFPGSARTWIYQSDRPFTQEEEAGISALLQQFTRDWTAHNQQLSAGFEIRHHQFIVLIVDESQAGASGCSIDKSVRMMQDLENRFNLRLFDRFALAYRKNQGEIGTVNRETFERMILQGEIGSSTIVFNNLVQTVEELESGWEVPLAESWHARLFPVQA